ncbi:SCP2 domain-containing protein [Cellvibrio sp.]|uniref:ubiquinone biosynthesis accessory factor UbiJ n=1 Tax=Cellvibrio sp. TaxID=1965322 RepID=UPI00396479A5
MDPMLSTAAIAGVEKIINAALAYDPASRIALEQLTPQVLLVDVTSPAFKLFVVPTAEGINLRGQYEGEITTHIQGALPALISLAKSDQLNLKDTGVHIFGSTHFLAELQRILKNLEIDWEEMLSQIFGDIIGHQSAQLIRGKMSWAKDRAANIQRLTSEFLTEELRVLPNQAELAFFNNQVDELRLGADRVAARVDQILARIARQSAQ